MNDDLEATLQDGLLRPPADFTQRVMQRVAAQTLAAPGLGAGHGPLGHGVTVDPLRFG